MQALLSFLGLLMAIYVWNTGHPVWAIVVGFLFIGGAGWMLPLWLARGVTAPRPAQPDAAFAAYLSTVPTEAEVAAQAMDEYGVDLSRATLVRPASIDSGGTIDFPEGFAPLYLLSNNRFFLYKRGWTHLGDCIRPRSEMSSDGQETLHLSSKQNVRVSVRGEDVRTVRDWYVG